MKDSLAKLEDCSCFVEKDILLEILHIAWCTKFGTMHRSRLVS